MTTYTVLDDLWPIDTGLDVSDIDPFQPTKAEPGTFEKLRVLHARALAGATMFHPLDEKGDDETCRFEGHLGSTKGPQSDIPRTLGRTGMNPRHLHLPRPR